jgi:hypothetical protein
MVEQHITDAKTLVEEVSAYGDRMAERRRHERKRGLWAATVDVRGQRFEGTIVDLSPGGARIRFDAAVAKGDELNIVLKQLDALGAKVVWQRAGEAGIQFMMAPEEMAARVKDQLARAPDVPPTIESLPLPSSRPGSAERPPSRRPPLTVIASLVIAVMALSGAVIGGATMLTGASSQEAPMTIYAVTAGATEQHSCGNRMDKVNGATNQVDFSLNVAAAVEAKCLDLKRITGDNDPRGRMVQATKVHIR